MPSFVQGRRPKSHTIELILWLVFISAIWGYSFKFDHELSSYAFGVVGWPRAILLLMIVCSVGLFFDRKRRERNSRIPKDAPTSPTPNGSETHLQIVGTFLIPLVYVALLPYAGFYATTPFFIIGYALLFGQRSVMNIIILTSVVSVVSLVVFTKFLYVPLPRGNWPGFYQFSNALIQFVR